MTGQAPLGTDLQPPGSLSLPAPVYGVDPSTRRISVACVKDGLEWAQTLSLPLVKDKQRRYGQWYRALVPWIADLSWGGPGFPSHVYVEEPFMPRDRRQPPASYYLMGVLWAALETALPLNVRFEEISAPAWKKRAMGEGKGAAKPEAYMAWARDVAGYTGSIEDEAAAVGIATAGGVIVSGG